MNTRVRISIAFCMLLAALFAVGSSSAQVQSPTTPQAIQVYMGTAFNYSGVISPPITGTFPFRFRLLQGYPPPGAQVGSTLTFPSIAVNTGRFSVLLDFGPGVFNGEERTLEIRRCTNPGCTAGPIWTVALRPTPYALALPGLWTQQNGTSANLIGGYWGNGMRVNVVGGTISGGGNAGNPNLVYDSYNTISGGRGNKVGTDNADLLDAQLATIGGGLTNEATNLAATVAGGWSNIASGQYAAVAGGEGNIASGSHASVPGGHQSTASGGLSLAAGNQAKATHQGAFVWADSQSADFFSAAVNQFSVRACGGARFVTCGQGLTVDGNPVQIRVSGVCSPGFAVRQINADGSVVCEATGGGGSFWSLTGNSSTNPATNFLGTTDNVVLEVRVNNARAFRYEPTTSGPNIIGGEASSSVTSGAIGATISGGMSNLITDDHGTIGGGIFNQAGDNAGTVSDVPFATVGGGYDNESTCYASVIAGGYANRATNVRSFVGGGVSNQSSGVDSTVTGGQTNTASGYISSIGGGMWNVASGYGATIPGGESNTAAGDWSFVAGRRAKNSNANHDNTFLYADGVNFDFNSIAANEFAVRSTGGARFVLAVDGSGNPTWTCSVSNGGSWACSSDRNLKENLVEVSGKQVLQVLENLPLYTWSAKGADPSVLHMGPTAQDFKAAFGLGDSDIAISTIDLDGVALAAIQGLKAENDELSASNASLQNRVDKLEQRLLTIEARQGVGLAAFLLYTLLIASALLIGLAAALLFKRRGGVK